MYGPHNLTLRGYFKKSEILRLIMKKDRNYTFDMVLKMGKFWYGFDEGDKRRGSSYRKGGYQN